MLGWVVDFAEVLAKILPFREARRERNRIKSEYRKNIRRIDTGEPVRTVAGYNTYHLGDGIEEMHMETETLIGNKGSKISERRVIRDGDEVYSFTVPEEHRDEIRGKMNDVIQAIQRKNRFTWILEVATYSIVGIIVIGLVVFFL